MKALLEVCRRTSKSAGLVTAGNDILLLTLELCCCRYNCPAAVLVMDSDPICGAMSSSQGGRRKFVRTLTQRTSVIVAVIIAVVKERKKEREKRCL